jgi:hypothetical protein
VRFRPTDTLGAELAARIPSSIARVAIDGPPCARPDAVAGAVAEFLRGKRPTAHIRADEFWRDASLRLEYGRHDIDSYLQWLDADALRREVLDPVVTSGSYLPSLRDPMTNRSTREPTRAAEPHTAVLVTGALLLGRDLPFDLTIHLAVSPAARARLTPAEDAWTLAAFDHYDAAVRPMEIADVVVRYDDPRHPAVSS